MSDDLFRPTVSATPTAPKALPWRVESLVFPAFFGGALPATVLGLINGRRLGVRPLPLTAIVATGVAALITRIVVTDQLDPTSTVRLLGSLAGVAVWGVIYLTQVRAFRRFLHLRLDPAPLWWPGLGAVLGLGLIEGLTVVLVTQ